MNNRLKLYDDLIYTYIEPKDKIKLRQIGMVFRCGKENWEYMYGLAKKYYQHYGNTSMDINFKTKNGYEYDSKGYCLGVWVNQQKIIYNNIFKNNQTEVQQKN